MAPPFAPVLIRAGLAEPLAAAGVPPEADAVPRLAPVALVPELVHLQSGDFADLWYHLAESHPDGHATCAPPYWAQCWPGGLALARYLLDRPAEVAGKRVVDLGSGGGLAALAAAAAGAARVTALDVDGQALAALRANAAANALHIHSREGDLATTPWPGEVVLAGDMCYELDVAERLLPLLTAAAGDRRVLLGEPGRPHAPEAWQPLAGYPMPAPAVLLEDERAITAGVFTPERPA